MDEILKFSWESIVTKLLPIINETADLSRYMLIIWIVYNQLSDLIKKLWITLLYLLKGNPFIWK